MARMWNAPHRLLCLNTWSQQVALFGSFWLWGAWLKDLSRWRSALEVIAASGSAWALCFPVAAGIRPRTTNPYCCALLPWWTASFKSWAPKNFSLQLLFPDRLWWPRENNNTLKANVYLCFRSIWNCCTVGKACGLLYETISMALF